MKHNSARGENNGIPKVKFNKHNGGKQYIEDGIP
jgi:hypothetical protein